MCVCAQLVLTHSAAARIEELGHEPLMRVLRSLGGWPVLGERSGWHTPTSEQQFDWLDLLIKFRRSGFSHDVLIDLSVTPDFRNNTQHIIDVSICYMCARARKCAANYCAFATN